MSGIKDKLRYFDDFLGHGLLPATQSDSDWLVDDTSSSGTPTYVKGGINGEAVLTFDSDVEIENVCLHHGDDLNFDIRDIEYAEFRVKMGQAALDSASQVAFGLCSARNDAIDSLAAHASFRVIGADDTTAIVVESDDGATDRDDIATGKTLVDAYQVFRIDFTKGLTDVRFMVNHARVAASTVFDMSNYALGLQPYLQLQKTADANVDSVSLDYVEIVSRRVL